MRVRNLRRPIRMKGLASLAGLVMGLTATGGLAAGTAAHASPKASAAGQAQGAAHRLSTFSP
jgi:hypothetical protein